MKERLSQMKSGHRVAKISEIISDLQEIQEKYGDIETPKTEAGTRIVPMLEEVKDALRTEWAKQEIITGGIFVGKLVDLSGRTFGLLISK